LKKTLHYLISLLKQKLVLNLHFLTKEQDTDSYLT
jgi:hypothetical protein